MHIFEVTAKVTRLCESLVTLRASERTLPGVLPEVISKITTLLEGAIAAWVSASEVELDPLRHWVPNSHGLVPLLRDALESLRLYLLLDTAREV